MNHKRNSAVLCLIAGAGLLAASFYIHGQVAEGREQISSAQKKVDQSNSLFSVSPYTKGVGNALTGSAQKRLTPAQLRLPTMRRWPICLNSAALAS